MASELKQNIYRYCNNDEIMKEILNDKVDGTKHFKKLVKKGIFDPKNNLEKYKQKLLHKMTSDYTFRPKYLSDIQAVISFWEKNAHSIEGNSRTLQKTTKVAKATKVSKNKKNAKPIKNNLNNKIKKGVKGGWLWSNTMRCKPLNTQQTAISTVPVAQPQTLSHVTPLNNSKSQNISMTEKQIKENQLIYDSLKSDPTMELIGIDPKTNQLIYQKKTRSMSTPQHSFNPPPQLVNNFYLSPHAIGNNMSRSRLPTNISRTYTSLQPQDTLTTIPTISELPPTITEFPPTITALPALPEQITKPLATRGIIKTEQIIVPAHSKGVKFNDVISFRGGLLLVRNRSKLFNLKKFLKPIKPTKATKVAKPTKATKATKVTLVAKPKKPTKAIKIKKPTKTTKTKKAPLRKL
jgi:hypothetical protein